MSIRDSEIFVNGKKQENILNFVIDSTVRSVTIKGKRV